MKYLKLLTLSLWGLLLFNACSKDETSALSMADNLVDYTASEHLIGTHDIAVLQSGVLQFHNLTGIQTTDKFAFKRVEDSQIIPLEWGYKYAGIVGDEDGYYQPDSDKNTIYIGIGFKDEWTVGKYDLLLLRGEKYQTIDQFQINILNNVNLDASALSASVISITADGWIDTQSYGHPDSLLIIDKATQEEVEKLPTSYVAGKSQTLQFNLSSEKYETGLYEVWIHRWNYDFRQKLGTLDYFSYKFVESTPITKDADGKYYIKFTVDDISAGNTYAIVDMPDQENYYDDGEFDPAFWDEATKTYRLELKTDEDHLFGEFKEGMYFIVQLNINGNDVTVSGENKLDL